MCTILTLFHAHPRAPLIIAANRDELYARASAPPQVLRRDPAAIGGRDLRHGGTWMGYNAAGLFVGLTNLRSPSALPSDLTSRGDIVLDLLACRSPDDLGERLERRLAREHARPFNLLFGDPAALYVAHYTPPTMGRTLDITRLDPGCHVLPSATRINDASHPKVPYARTQLEGIAVQSFDSDDALIDALHDLLADRHTPDPETLPEPLKESPFGDDFEAELQALCVRTPRYGTVSSTLLIAGAEPTRYLFCDGPPDRARPTPQLHLMTPEG